jgi:membrane protease YdiL (CAAX protease family)
MNWPYVWLGLAIIAVWFPAARLGRHSLPAWLPLYLASVGSALASGLVDWRGLLLLAVFAASVWGSRVAPRAWMRGVLMVTAGLFTLALPAKVFSAALGGVPIVGGYGMATAGLFLLVGYAQRITGIQDLRRVARPAAWVMAGTTAVVLGVAVAVGFLRFDPHVPEGAAARTLSNLLFICVAEEAFFRGLLQERLRALVARWPWWRWLPIALASVLFGLAHAGKGLVLAGLATLAGVGYGLACARTRRIEPAILTHFAVNTAHYFLFTGAMG